MRFNDVLHYTLGTMRRRRARTVLTSLGVTIAIAVIVALLSITQGLQTSVQNELCNGLGTDTLTITSKSGEYLPINETATIETIDHVALAVPLIQRSGYLKEGSSTVKVSIIGVDIDKYRQVYSAAFVTSTGSVPSGPDNNVLIIGARVADPGLNGTISFPVGSPASVLKQESNGQEKAGMIYSGTVTGVLNPVGPLTVGALSDTSIYIPIEQAESFYATDQCSLIIVKLADSSQATKDEVAAALTERFGGQAEISQSGLIDKVVSRVFSLLDLFLIGVACITLLIAGIGIMNTMTISLIERTREIGTLKSLGLQDRRVLTIFLCEAAIVGILGAIFGVALGLLLANIMAWFVNGSALLSWVGLGNYAGFTLVPELSIVTILSVIAFGVLISILFSLYPAWRASRLSPMEALRRE